MELIRQSRLAVATALLGAAVLIAALLAAITGGDGGTGRHLATSGSEVSAGDHTPSHFGWSTTGEGDVASPPSPAAAATSSSPGTRPATASGTAGRPAPRSAPTTTAPDPAKALTPLPPGSIAYPFGRDVIAMRADGTDSRTLKAASDFIPEAWSPSGSLLALRSASGPSGVYDVRIVDSVGNVVQTIPHAGRTVVWSPDSTKIATTTPPGIPPPSPLRVYDVRSGRLLFESPTFRPQTRVAWAPSARIAVVGGDGSDTRVFTMNSDGTDVRDLPQTAPAAGGPLSWAPDGRILFLGTPAAMPLGLYTVHDSPSDAPKLVTTDAVDDAELSPDGSTVVGNAFSQSNPDQFLQWDLRVWRSDGSGPITTLATQVSFGEMAHSYLSARRLIFRSPDGFLWNTSVDGRDRQQLLFNGGQSPMDDKFAASITRA